MHHTQPHNPERTGAHRKAQLPDQSGTRQETQVQAGGKLHDGFRGVHLGSPHACLKLTVRRYGCQSKQKQDTKRRSPRHRRCSTLLRNHFQALCVYLLRSGNCPELYGKIGG